MTTELPADWATLLATHVNTPEWSALQAFVAAERASHTIYPSAAHTFAAFEHTPVDTVRVLLLGQDPYHGPNQAHGLCFSVPEGARFPPSLRNMLKELETDLNIPARPHGDLSAWAHQGVLLLNTVLTVREGAANSHQKQGWEAFTDAVIAALSERSDPIVFVLWGNPARRKKRLIDTNRHRIVEGAHPSPLSAYRGFFGSRPYSAVNRHLAELGYRDIDWAAA